ncbi:bifunctional adenosylcobinamide kinase/adenosylcobinamide-phosphate guanylyltransferase [Rhodospirillum rubrum]|uniref:bifunctional adenosylcobinamide kinase/adenosylcobinamide-phosphate guanylyltransferase n=1 Tax=Rhodospirillum rubrum TaxID=1085 RepID=UPI001906ED07|nr:bifunctional adenosylcobinamide kinase/adenosylcobinamide-phosphate guanylyltransferase [Rhodospirillum rubrum]MBK1663985.1 bifunctional adenosylcobinamide kinase/adenosylcobinamide-phosphate guanylyltransferase [Rhodospirillum rubrum]MBK1675457.1 bifunctional adenosylcobinamide kinase/adenosylcobinamide-phosphate guanylyltransferase [Rhodospirillum rubrum]
MSILPFDPETAPLGPRLTLVLGGARSGKSRLAERLVLRHGARALYVATAEVGEDGEMAERVEAHRARRGAGWTTVEAPMSLPVALMAHGGDAQRPILVDCLTLWLSNLMLADRPEEPAVAALEGALRNVRSPVVLVSNEVGQGIVPMEALSRRFRDAQGVLNQRMATLCGRVVLCAAGLPLVLKDLPDLE